MLESSHMTDLSMLQHKYGDDKANKEEITKKKKA